MAIQTESLTIVIPALNEEEAIGGTIRATLDARDSILRSAGLSAIEVVVVSDGSTDRTADISRSFREVCTISFEENRGYGAAIKEGWHRGTGSLLGVLDADATCDPCFFSELCIAAIEQSADVVTGSRMGPTSKMPRLRRLGNRLYALVVGFLCGRQVTDVASGMRVVKRSALARLSPLPEGLDFTLSLSTRALLHDLRVVEIPMTYADRIGTSKLNVVKDGLRFAFAIMASVVIFRPEKLLLTGVGVAGLLFVLVGAAPIEHYILYRRLEEWMIYRFVACYVLASTSVLLLLATALANRISSLGPRRRGTTSFWSGVTTGILKGKMLGLISFFWLGASLWFFFPGMTEFVYTKSVSLHWSRLLAGTFGLLCLIQTMVFALLLKVTSFRFDGKDSETPPCSFPESKESPVQYQG